MHLETSYFGEKITECVLASRLYESMVSKLGLKKHEREFVGSHPISLSLSQVGMLLEEDYYVCEKSDGIREMLFLYDKTLYLYDRKNVFYRTRYRVTDETIFLLEGEIYIEECKYIFAIFDALIYKDENITSENLPTRLRFAHQFVRRLHTAMGFCISIDSRYHKFSIVLKDMMKSYGLGAILEAIPTMKHSNDGLIFTAVTDQYLLKKRSRTLKWKLPHLNTVDFLLTISERIARAYDIYVLASAVQLGTNSWQ
jgi:mRNA guanylyltransferase